MVEGPTRHGPGESSHPCHRGLRAWLLVVLALLAAAGFAAGQDYVPGRLLVKLRDAKGATTLSRKLARFPAPQLVASAKSDWRVVQVAEPDAELLLSELRSDPSVAYAERDAIAHLALMPNDPCFQSGQEWHLGRISAPAGWNLSAGASNVIVAVLDSGVDATHPDLQGRVMPGFNFVSNTSDTTDEMGHGTAVTGVIVASGNNQTGVAGVAFESRVLAVKVADSSGSASYSAIIQGIHYAVEQGARIINISIAGQTPSVALQEAIDYAWSSNALVVAAAGNAGSDVLFFPAACEHVIGVTATLPDDSLAQFSSYGAHVTLAAPGEDIWTTQRDPAGLFGPSRGTSFASPIVAGVAAQVLAAAPWLSADEVFNHLTTTADDLGRAGRDSSFGFGRVNAFRAIVAANPGATNSVTVPPLVTVTNTQAISPVTNVPVATEIASWKGRYAGLIASESGVAPESSGCFRLNVTRSGRFTGRLRLASGSVGFSGQFDASGQASITLQRAHQAPINLMLRLDLAEGADRVSGTVSTAHWSAELSGDRDIFSSRANPARQAGRHDFVLRQASVAPETAAATGLGKITRGGHVGVRGRLMDGRPFANGSQLARNGDYPFFASFDRGTEVVIGWLNFPAAGNPVANGTVLWVNAGANAFARTLQAR